MKDSTVAKRFMNLTRKKSEKIKQSQGVIIAGHLEWKKCEEANTHNHEKQQ